MRKRNKITTIALIFMLIGVVLCSNTTYALSFFCLRPQLVFDDSQENHITKKKALRWLEKDFKRKTKELTVIFTQTLSPLKKSKIKIKKIKILFSPREEEIYKKISEIKENFIKRAILLDNFEEYMDFRISDLPEENMCQVISHFLNCALHDIGLDSDIDSIKGHYFVKLSGHKKLIAIDLASGQVIPKNARHVAVALLDDYKKELPLRISEKKHRDTMNAFLKLDDLNEEFVEAKAEILSLILQSAKTSFSSL